MRTLVFLMLTLSTVSFAEILDPAPKAIQNDTAVNTIPAYSFFTDKTNLISLGLGITAAAILYENDQSIYDEFIEKEHKLPAHGAILSFSRNYGKTHFMIPVLATVWFGSLTVPESDLAEATQNAIKAFLISGAMVTLLKVTAHRHRPNTGSRAYNFDGPDYFDYDNGHLSFPSGDAQTAWSIMTSYALTFGHRSILVPIGCYTVASLVTLGRVYDRAHWPSDAFSGSFIGFMTAYNVFKYRESAKSEKTKLSIQPAILNDHYYGAALDFKF